MAVIVSAVCVIVGMVVLDRARPAQEEPEMAMRSGVGVAVYPAPVPVR